MESFEDQWEKLLPRERDALVAEKVFGFKTGVYAHGDQPEIITPDNQFLRIPRYSSDLAAAWEVVEHMRRFHFRDVLSLVSPTDDCRSYRAMFSKKCAADMDSYPADMGMGESASEAICLAALNALAKYPLARP